MHHINAVIDKLSNELQYDFDSEETNLIRFHIAQYALRAVYDKKVQLEAECINRIGQVKGDVKENFLSALEVIEAEVVLKALDAYLEGDASVNS